MTAQTLVPYSSKRGLSGAPVQKPKAKSQKQVPSLAQGRLFDYALSFHPQCVGRVDRGGTPGRNPGGDKRNQDEHDWHQRKRERVVRGDAVEKT